MITLYLFIGYQQHICPKNLILAEKALFLEIDHFDLLDISNEVVLCIVSTYTSQSIYK